MWEWVSEGVESGGVKELAGASAFEDALKQIP